MSKTTKLTKDQQKSIAHKDYQFVYKSAWRRFKSITESAYEEYLHKCEGIDISAQPTAIKLKGGK